MSKPLSRRRFLQSVAGAAAAAPWVWTPSRLAAQGPALSAVEGPVLRHASIGAGGQALSDINSFARHPAFKLVAVADVDLARVEPLRRRFPDVRVYQDWRVMLGSEQDVIDSVNVSVPDHMHCLMALEAMKRGKAVYVEKPLCNTIRETRILSDYARRHRVTTQMGIQISSTKPQRYGEALVRSGIVGKIREVHTFSNKNWGDGAPLAAASDPVPAPLDWDGWLGVSETRPFKQRAYHPGEWRRRIGFGTGTLGDMGCHIYSPPYRALKLTSPIAVTAYGPPPTAESWATKARVKLTYPGTEFTAGKMVDVWWYDGGELPPDAIREQVGSRWPQQGSVVVGTEGIIVLPHVSPEPFVLKQGAAVTALPTFDLPDRDHYGEFIDAVLKSGKGHWARCSTDFSYSGPLSESVIIGNVAARFSGETLEFDAQGLKFPNKPEANQYLTRQYRDGWEIRT
jgi:predicted dehydrogenase